MDLKSYYSRIRETEALILHNHVVIISNSTPEGGKAGVRTEVSRAIAARIIAEGRARLATDEEAAEFRQSQQAAKEKFDQEEAARRVQVMVIPSHELRKQKDRNS
jgi:hypothetical protein